MAMTKRSFIPALILTAAAALPACAATGRTAITTEQIATALNNSGMRITAGQVVLLADVVASTSAPELRVESMERQGDGRMEVRLDCASTQQCLPFFVAINLGKLGKDDAVTQPFVAPPNSPVRGVVPARPNPSAYVVHAGSPAVLMLEGDHVHIRVSVICLENGVAGQTIQVVSKDHQKTYAAQVADGTVLKGGL
jgi:Chaperone for flagella basal body P-ring formation